LSSLFCFKYCFNLCQQSTQGFHRVLVGFHKQIGRLVVRSKPDTSDLLSLQDRGINNQRFLHRSHVPVDSETGLERDFLDRLTEPVCTSITHLSPSSFWSDSRPSH